mgnify:CR=1 FL=1
MPPTDVVTLPLTPMISTLLVPLAIELTAMSPAVNVPVTDKFDTVSVFVLFAHTKLDEPPNPLESLKTTCVLLVVNVGIPPVAPLACFTCNVPLVSAKTVVFPLDGLGISFLFSLLIAEVVPLDGILSNSDCMSKANFGVFR